MRLNTASFLGRVLHVESTVSTLLTFLFQTFVLFLHVSILALSKEVGHSRLDSISILSVESVAFFSNICVKLLTIQKP